MKHKNTHKHPATTQPPVFPRGSAAHGGSPAPEPSPKENKAPSRAAQGTAQANPKDKLPDNRAILSELKLVRDLTSDTEKPVILSFEPIGKIADSSSSAAADAAAASGTISPTIQVGSGSQYAVKVGDVLYAVVSTALNSDIPSPVMATVVEGRLKGAKVLGAFQLTGERVLLSFDRLITKDGVLMGIRGVGVDPDTSEATVKSRVNTHFWERWGSLIGASFIEGLGRAAGRKNTRVYVNDNSVVEDGTSRTMSDITLESMEKVGQRAANQVERGFDRLPTVTVEAGEHVGVLILEAETGS
jgi:type IV secretory pathway VirB10-like protein